MKVTGAAKHGPTAGVLCTKVARYTERTYHRDRLLHPLRRVGRKGEGRFERISWDDAIGTIAERLGRIAAEDPEAILPYSYAGTMGLVQGESMSQRFFHRLGASLLDRTICAAAGAAGHRITLGPSIGMDVEVAEQAKLIIFWGCNAITSSVHFWAPGAGGEAPRRAAHRNRSLSLARQPRNVTSTSRCCRGRTARSRSGSCTCSSATISSTMTTSSATRWASRSSPSGCAPMIRCAWPLFAASRRARSNPSRRTTARLGPR